MDTLQVAQMAAQEASGVMAARCSGSKGDEGKFWLGIGGGRPMREMSKWWMTRSPTCK